MGKNGETPNPGGGNKGGTIKIPRQPAPTKGGIGKITGR